MRSTSQIVFLCYRLVYLMSSSDSDVTEILVTLVHNAYLIKIKVRFYRQYDGIKLVRNAYLIEIKVRF